MSTFFYNLIEFPFLTSFWKLFAVPIPFYCLALFYRVFCPHGFSYGDKQ